MHCGLCENKGQSTKCVSEEERKSRDGPPSAYAHVSERSIQQSRAFRHGFSPTAILKIGDKSNAAISSAHCAASWENRHKRRACRTDAFPDMTTTIWQRTSLSIIDTDVFYLNSITFKHITLYLLHLIALHFF